MATTENPAANGAPGLDQPSDVTPGIAAKASGPIQTVKSDQLPSPETLQRIYECDVQDKDGKAVKFGSLVQQTTHKRTVVVFVRHFLCGFCQEYIRALTNDLPPSRLESMSIATNLVIVGCGDPSMIAGYASETSCPYPIYADPTRKIYTALGLVVNLGASPKKPNYISVSFFTSTLAGIKQGLKAGFSAIGKSGKISQNGGELVWLDGECRFIHKMKDTTSHLEIKDLEHVLEETV